MSFRSLNTLPVSETLDLGNGLSLVPRLKLVLTIFRSDPSVKPIDEWQLKLSLLNFIRNPLSLIVSDDDLNLQKCKDLRKRKRDDPVASGTLYLRDLSFLEKNGVEGDAKIMERRFGEWKRSVVDRMNGIDLNLEGVKFGLSVSVPESDDFETLKKSWEDFYSSDNRGYYPRSARQQPDTLLLEGIPSRWFAEPRVSSKASMLVTHTIFSAFGKIRNLNVGGADDLGKTTEEAKGGIVSGLQCKIWAQFEKYDDFCNALKVLCGRSMQKQGSRLIANYEVTWDREGYFRSMQRRRTGDQLQESASRVWASPGDPKSEAPRLQSQITRYGSNDAWPKRFKSRQASCTIDLSKSTASITILEKWEVQGKVGNCLSQLLAPVHRPCLQQLGCRALKLRTHLRNCEPRLEKIPLFSLDFNPGLVELLNKGLTLA